MGFSEYSDELGPDAPTVYVTTIHPRYDKLPRPYPGPHEERAEAQANVALVNAARKNVTVDVFVATRGSKDLRFLVAHLVDEIESLRDRLTESRRREACDITYHLREDGETREKRNRINQYLERRVVESRERRKRIVLLESMISILEAVLFPKAVSPLTSVPAPAQGVDLLNRCRSELEELKKDC